MPILNIPTKLNSDWKTFFNRKVFNQVYKKFGLFDKQITQ